MVRKVSKYVQKSIYIVHHQSVHNIQSFMVIIEY